MRSISDAAAGENAQGEPPVDNMEKIRSVIASQLGVPLSKITPETKLEGLVDSLDLIEMVFALEVAFGIDIPFNVKDATSGKLQTIGDVGRRIEKLLSEKRDAV